MSATTTQLLSSGEFCKLRYDTIPVKSASANVSFYTNNSKMPNFELWHSCRKWAMWCFMHLSNWTCRVINKKLEGSWQIVCFKVIQRFGTIKTFLDLTQFQVPQFQASAFLKKWVIAVKILCITLSCKFVNTDVSYHNCANVRNKLINVARLVNTVNLSHVVNQYCSVLTFSMHFGS